MGKVKFLSKLKNVKNLPEDEVKKLERVTEIYPFRSNTYYLSLVNWEDKNDPIRRIIIPSQEETTDWGEVDPSREHLYSPAPGLQHKYENTALFLLTDVCGGYCRFCFRKRLFMNKGFQQELVRDIRPAIRYIKAHPEINNVLLTGGDPLILPTGKLEGIISKLMAIDHVKAVRIGSKMLAYNPHRVIDDPSFTETLSRFSSGHKRIYVMTHFNHTSEITDHTKRAVEALQKSGVVLANQTPILRGINDTPKALNDLFSSLTALGIAPYYVFQCRPTIGNRNFVVPVEESLEIFEQARGTSSGLSKRARLIMSHYTGKIEIVGKYEEQVLFKYYHTARRLNIQPGQIIMCKSNPEALWFDDYPEAASFLMKHSAVLRA